MAYARLADAYVKLKIAILIDDCETYFRGLELAGVGRD